MIHQQICANLTGGLNKREDDPSISGGTRTTSIKVKRGIVVYLRIVVDIF